MGLYIRSASLNLPPHPRPYPLPKVGEAGQGNLTDWGTTISQLSPPQRPLCVVGRLGRKKKKGRGFPPSHSPPLVFYFFFCIAIFIGVHGVSFCSGEISQRIKVPPIPGVSFEAGRWTQRPVVWPQRFFQSKIDLNHILPTQLWNAHNFLYNAQFFM